MVRVSRDLLFILLSLATLAVSSGQRAARPPSSSDGDGGSLEARASEDVDSMLKSSAHGLEELLHIGPANNYGKGESMHERFLRRHKTTGTSLWYQRFYRQKSTSESLTLPTRPPTRPPAPTRGRGPTRRPTRRPTSPPPTKESVEASSSVSPKQDTTVCTRLLEFFHRDSSSQNAAIQNFCLRS